MTGKRILLGKTGVVVLGILGWYQVVNRPETKPEAKAGSSWD